MAFLSILLSFLLLSLFFTLHHLLLTTILSSLKKASASSYGPKSHPFIGSFILFYKNRGRLLDWFTQLIAVSPSKTILISRLGARRTIITANPDNVEHILKLNFPNYPKGKPFTDLLGDLLGQGIFNSDGDVWFRQRKLAAHHFSARTLRCLLYSTLQSEADESLLPFLYSQCGDHHEGGPRCFDLQELLRMFSFNVICKISMGISTLTVDGTGNTLASSFNTAFDVASAVSARRGAAPVPALWKLKRALNVGSERQLNEAVGLIHKAVMEIIQERKSKYRYQEQEKDQENNNNNNGNNNIDMLSRLIADGSHSDEAIRDMVISFIMAGRDTTSSALTWFFWLVSCHPDKESELLQEIRRLTNKPLDYERLKEMKLLEACLYESMRLYPPVVWTRSMRRMTTTLPDGTEVRRGDRVTYFPYGMGRMESIWGKDWMEFRPKRWLNDEENNEVVKVSAYKYPVFQGGPRVCLGKEMAFVQMKYVAATLMREFEMTRVGTETPVMVPLLTAHMAGGLKVVVKKRRMLHMH